MKKLLKSVLHYGGVNRIMAALLNHVLHLLIEEHPELFEKMRNRYTADRNRLLLSRIKSKGSGVVLNGEVTITHPLGMAIGNNVHIGNNAYIHSRGGVTIGDNTHISRNLLLYSCNHQYEGEVLPFDSSYVDKPVTIGRNVWVGMNVNIVPGVTIGEGAIIGMGVTVSRNVNPYEIVGSAPTRVLKQREQEHYQRLVALNRYGAVNGKKVDADQLEQYLGNARDLGAKAFFVLGTGRSGSTAISRILSKHPEITCLHEPKFHLLRLSTLWLHGEITEKQVFQELQTLFLDTNIYPSGCYGESDQKLMPFIPQIAKLLPEAKFIWLIRNPLDTVNSTFSRGWFDDLELGFNDKDRLDYVLHRDVYSDYRPHADKIGLMTTEGWRAMTPFERNCWYWSYWNSEIGRLLGALDKSRSIKIKLEELNQKLPYLLEFLGVAPETLVTEVSNRAEKRHRLYTSDEWSSDMKASFDKWCVKSDLFY